jgi:hypothetical protein
MGYLTTPFQLRDFVESNGKVIIFDELEIISNKLLWLILICYSEFARTK